MLTRENSITSIISPKVEGLTDSIDEWYKAKYNCQKNTYKYRDNEDLCGILQMPPINPFIPKSFDGEKRESMDVPIELKDSIYYKYVSRYGTPYSYAYIKIDMDKTYGDTFQTVLNCVFTDVLHETLNPILYVASNLRYHWTTKYTDGGIYFTFSGFSDRISDISEYVVDCLNDMKSRFTIENFERTVSKLNLHWKNNKYGLLYNNISRYASEEIDPMFPTIDKMIEQLNKLKFDDLFGYFEGKSMKVTALIEGDISEENALKIVEPFFDFVSKRSIGDYTNNFLKEYINKEDINGKAIYKPSENDKELSSCIHISYLYGYSSSLKTHDYYKINVHSILLANLIKDAFYNQLRTKEQLGYAVFSQRTSYGMSQYTLRAQSFTIQSLSMKAVNLVNRVEDFITKFIDDITSLTDEKLEKYKGSLIESYNKTPVNLSEEAGNDLLAIILNDYVFNWREIYINEIKKIDKKSIEEFYRTYFLSGSSVTKFVLGIDPVKME
jgi:secreted Zn-dependent insulinase-like peptidase